MTLALPRLDRTTAEERGLTIADFLVPIRVGERLNARVRDLTLVAAAALLVYLTARISFPVPGSPVPFFAEGKGGLAIIWGATGGYLVGFAIAGALVGRLAELGWDRRLGGALGAMLLGNVVIYLVGLPWLKVVTGMSVQDTVANGLTPFLVGDALKLVLAAVLFPAAWWIVGRRPDDR
jgi:biotin transport system substrate-specific component